MDSFPKFRETTEYFCEKKGSIQAANLLGGRAPILQLAGFYQGRPETLALIWDLKKWLLPTVRRQPSCPVWILGICCPAT